MYLFLKKVLFKDANWYWRLVRYCNVQIAKKFNNRLAIKRGKCSMKCLIGKSSAWDTLLPKLGLINRATIVQKRTLGLQIDERPLGIVKLLKLLQETNTHSHSWKVSLSNQYLSQRRDHSLLEQLEKNIGNLYKG